jgi:predicted RNase H-like nuclease (RuvC/YqgF family)
MRFTIDEYSKQFKMSKELINSKLRSKRLNYIIEDGETYIVIMQSSLDEKKIEEIEQQREEKQLDVVTQKMTVGMILSLYKKENEHLKQKIRELENKIDSLITDKENMLRQERDRIEQLYTTKDEQLKNILELMNQKFMLEQKMATVHEVTLSSNLEMQKAENLSHVELKTYLKTLDLESYQRKIIKKRFFDALDNDVRIIQQNGKLYLDFDKYDYSDLLKL